jgi:hypothetical protein
LWASIVALVIHLKLSQEINMFCVDKKRKDDNDEQFGKRT